MKLYKLSFALILGIGALASCSDKLDQTNPNQQTTATFGNSASELEEVVIAAYNHTRMEGTYARVGYNIDVMRGDEAWNCSQVWYMPFDDLDEPTTDEIGQWSWRDWYYTINVCNYVITKVESMEAPTEAMNRCLGQALFIRGLGYYNLVNYYQNPPLITDYDSYSSIEGLYVSNQPEDQNTYQYDVVLDQVEKDFEQAAGLLPSKSEGGEWAKGRATSGAAAGYLARALMQRHKYSEALVYLEKIIKGDYGTYKLMDNYGDNFREGSAYENNDESLYEVQFLDKDQQGSDDEWTPVNTSKNATQGSAIESNFAPGDVGGWADIAASPWLYNLYKGERTALGTKGSLDPRLYWTIGTYEDEWNSTPNGTLGNVCYGEKLADYSVVVNNNYGGLPIAKWTHFRTGEYTKVVTGLHDGINIRLMRYSDVLLRAAECINEVSGPTQTAIDYINQVRRRAKLADLELKNFTSADQLFEQIANVERPKEFGCEYGRGNDLLRWGWFYDQDRMKQLKEHGTFYKGLDKTLMKEPVSYNQVSTDKEHYKSSYDTYVDGHEFLPVYQGTLNDNASLVGNSANFSQSNAAYFSSKGWKVHPVTKLPGEY